MDVSANKGVSGDAFVVGVDFGTLSARALVVRVSDGAEAGTAVSEYPHGVIDRIAGRARRAAAGLGAAGPGRLHRRAGRRRPGRGQGRGHRPGPGDRHRHRLHRVHLHAGARRRHAAVPAARPGRAPARLPQAVEASRGPAARGPDQRRRARAGREVDQPLRRQDLLGVAVRQGAAAARRGSRAVPARRPVDRGRRLDHLAAVRDRDQERVHGRVQGHLPGRQLPVPGVPGRAGPALRRLRRRQARPSDLAARRPGRRPDPGRGHADRAACRYRGGHRERGRARHRARGRPGRGGQDGGDHGHLDVPRHERAAEHERRRAGRGARHVRGGRRRHRRRAVGLRGGAERGRRHLRLVHLERGPGRVRRGSQAARRVAAAAARREGDGGAGRRARADRAGLGRVAIVRSW